MRRAWFLLLFAGCSQVFGFQEPVVVDSATDTQTVPDASVCPDTTATCATDNVLRTCTAVGELPTDTACSWGCVDTGGAHCGVLDPTGSVVTAADLAPDGALLDIEIAAGTTIDTDTGQISNVRVAGLGVISSIGFEVRGPIGLYRFKSVHFGGAVAVRGSRALVIAADGAIAIDASFDARGSCTANAAGPGGSIGGQNAENGEGAGAGARGQNAGTNDVAGGGGAGYGIAGSIGGEGLSVPGGPAGAAYGDPEISTLAGGSGGGTGGRGSDGGFGGGGGGAVFLASNTSIAIAAAGGINAGGCGGGAAKSSLGGGGGGGSGGAVLLEAPSIAVTGTIAANGGGGGGGGSTSQPGQAGKMSTDPANGGSSAIDGDGGDGGTVATPSGQIGESSNRAGGGGGAVGRIRINTRSGQALGGTFSPLSSQGAAAID